jgi:hypothetical protein
MALKRRERDFVTVIVSTIEEIQEKNILRHVVHFNAYTCSLSFSVTRQRPLLRNNIKSNTRTMDKAAHARAYRLFVVWQK